MSMPPSGGIGIMDEESLIQAQIDLELQNIQLDQDDDDDIEDILPDDETEDDGAEDTMVPSELDAYIKRIQDQTSHFEQELEECDELIHHTDRPTESSMAMMPYDDHQLLVQLASDRGCDIETYKQKILAELDQDDHILDEDVLDFIDHSAEESRPRHTDPDKPVNSESVDTGAGDGQEITRHETGLKMDRAITEAVETGVYPGDMPVSQEVVLANKNSHAEIQRMLHQQLERLEHRYKERAEKIKKEEAFSRNEDDVREHRAEEERRFKQEEIQREEQKLATEREAVQRKIAKEEKCREEEMQESIRTFQMEMAVMEQQTLREKEEFEQNMAKQHARLEEKRRNAVYRIQKIYRGYRVRKEYNPVLQEKKLEWKRQKEEERIKEVEVELIERKKEKDKKEEDKRQKEEEEKQKTEELKKQKELEKQQKEEEKRRKKEEEKRRKEEEKKQLEEEKQRKKEEEKKRKEEEKKKKEEEEKRKKEEKRFKEEEEKRKKEEEKRKKEEEKRLKEEEKKRKEEEFKLKKEEEERNKKEEERQKLEEEERKKKEEKEAEERSNPEKERQDEEEEQKKEIEASHSKPSVSEHDKDKEAESVETEQPAQQKVKVSTESEKVAYRSSTESASKIISETTNDNDNTEVVNAAKKSHTDGEKSEGSASKTPRSARRPGTPRKESHPLKKSQDKTAVNGEEKPAEINDGLPDGLEKKRIQWIKDCLPWGKISNEPWKLKTSGSRKPLRRPSSAKKLPPLADELIIQAARVVSLKQVTTVQLQDLPGTNMSSLGQCWGLKSLSMVNCNLMAIYGLEQCKQLQYLELRNNCIEFVDVKDIGQLQYIDLSHNRLSTIHGLDNCTNIRCLNVSHNKITRIGGMETLRRVHTLDLSHNQVISTHGLCDTPTIQVLNLSHNHLQEVDDLEKSCLLIHLDVSSNNLLKVPCLRNQVLLTSLLLEDNSITSLDELSKYWLPLLQTVKLEQNSLDSLPVMENCHLLRELDVSSNQLLEPDMLLKSLEGLVFLEVLHFEDNPLVQDLDSKFNEKLRSLLPRLHSKTGSPIKSRSSYEAMCLTQAQFYRDLQNHLHQDVESCQHHLSSSSLEKLGDVHYKYCEKSFKMSVEYRYAHEYGEVTVTMPTAPTAPKSGRPKSSRSKGLAKEETYISPKEMFEKALNSSSSVRGPSLISSAVNNDFPKTETKTDSFMSPKEMFENALNSSSSTAAMSSKMVQHQSNSGPVKADFVQSEKQKMSSSGTSANGLPVQRSQAEITEAVVVIQSSIRGYLARRKYLPMIRHNLEKRQQVAMIDPELVQMFHQAAVKIQACWKGYYLRSKLLAALEYARLDEDEDEDEMDLDGDFDVDKFMGFSGEDLLDDEWKPPETPQIPASHPVLKKPPSGRNRVPPLNIGADRPPSNPRRAWRNSESPLSDILLPQGHVPHPPSSVMSGDTHRTALSRKEEKITEEWGFKDSSTAQHMLQRAKKMKYNAERKKKLGKLDPKQRLALFRKLEEVTHPTNHMVQQPQRKTLPRKEYFQARQDEIERQEQEKRMEYQVRASRTYEWLHMQVGDHEITDSIINKRQHQPQAQFVGTDNNLPRMDPDVQLGRRVQLVSSPSLELQSIDSVSNASDRHRRLSLGNTGTTPSKGLFPPIQTGSAPTSHVKERMTWRIKQANQTVGWGGGKKRSGK